MAGWSKSQWQRFIRQAAGEARNVIFTDHALLRMRQRQISRDAAMAILRKGMLHREPEPNQRHGTWECRMEYYIAGRHLALVAAVDAADPAVVVVTAIDLDRG